MSYRMHIARHTKQTEDEKNTIFQKVIIPNMQKDDDYKDYFLNHIFLEKFGCEELLCLYDESEIHQIHKQCENFIPKETTQIFADYLPQIPSDESYIGILTKDLLLDYLKALHQAQINYYIRQYETCQSDPKIAQEYMLNHLRNQRITWETSMEFLNDKQIPFAVTNSYLYFLYQIFEIYKNTDFTKDELILYGW